MTSRLALGAAAVAMLTTTLMGPGSPATASPAASPAASSAAAGDPSYGAPTVGQCHAMSRSEHFQNSYTEAPVDCAGANTSEVIAVPTLPDGVGYARLGRLTRFMLNTCGPVLEDRLGTTTLGVRMTAYSIAWFIPTEAQRAAGARWLRCDVIRYGGLRLLPLPDSLGVGSFPFPRNASRCLVGKRRLTTACSEPHTYRATAGYKVRAKRYPTRDGWMRIAARSCPNGVTTPRNYWVIWSSRDAWRTGDRAIVCFSRTRR